MFFEGSAVCNLKAGLSSLGVPGVPWHTQILADQLTLFQPGGAHYPPPDFQTLRRPWIMVHYSIFNVTRFVFNFLLLGLFLARYGLILKILNKYSFINWNYYSTIQQL